MLVYMLGSGGDLMTPLQQAPGVAWVTIKLAEAALLAWMLRCRPMPLLLIMLVLAVLGWIAVYLGAPALLGCIRTALGNGELTRSFPVEIGAALLFVTTCSLITTGMAVWLARAHRTRPWKRVVPSVLCAEGVAAFIVVPAYWVASDISLWLAIKEESPPPSVQNRMLPDVAVVFIAEATGSAIALYPATGAQRVLAPGNDVGPAGCLTVKPANGDEAAVWLYSNSTMHSNVLSPVMVDREWLLTRAPESGEDFTGDAAPLPSVEARWEARAGPLAFLGVNWRATGRGSRYRHVALLTPWHRAYVGNLSWVGDGLLVLHLRPNEVLLLDCEDGSVYRLATGRSPLVVVTSPRTGLE